MIGEVAVNCTTPETGAPDERIRSKLQEGVNKCQSNAGPISVRRHFHLPCQRRASAYYVQRRREDRRK